ncbi:hypothetical protein SADUNF_Sadunf16G0017900 [Salix dunnii]|uniref:Uncharacterized protein n=1 Tax=Salix dunnii TaxID=1413687 RepID=A0A835J8M2_9ROSI|nr:hypothetical protein SADUNF_Sadunf16G0017900 [Salix dunnii]
MISYPLEIHGCFDKVINENETLQPKVEDTNCTLRKWKIKKGKALFALKTTVDDDMLEHIRDVKTPKEAWDIFVKLFSNKSNTRPQLLENKWDVEAIFSTEDDDDELAFTTTIFDQIDYEKD